MRLRHICAVVALSFSVGCGSLDATLKNVVVTANTAQDASARAYNDAKAATVKAGLDCGTAARARSVRTELVAIVDVSTAEVAVRQCAALGVYVPFNPVRLNALVGPLNASREAILGIDAARKAALAKQASNYGLAIARAMAALRSFYLAAQDAGLNFSAPLLDNFLGTAAKVK